MDRGKTTQTNYRYEKFYTLRMKVIGKFFEYVVIFWALQIILAWTLSLFEIYNTKYVLLFTLLLFLLFLLKIYKGGNKIKVFFNSSKRKFTYLNKISKITIIITSLVWIIFFIYSLFFIFLSPSVNWDSLTYHLTKVALANQTGSWWYNAEVSVARVNIFGSNASILDGVAFSIIGKDYMVELPQLIAALLIPLSLFYIGVNFFKKRKIYAFVSTIGVLSIPLYLYESKTTQNDLVFTLILLLSIIAVHGFFKHFTIRNFILVLLSIGILCGTKYHGLIASVILGLFIIYNLFRNRKLIKKNHILITLPLIPILVLLAIPSNIIGGLYYNSVLALDSGDAKKVSIGIHTLWINIKHFGEWFYLRTIGDPNYFAFDVGHAGFINMLAVPIFIIIIIKIFIKRNLDKFLFVGTIAGTILILFLVRAPDQWDLRLILFYQFVLYIYQRFFFFQSNTMP